MVIGWATGGHPHADCTLAVGGAGAVRLLIPAAPRRPWYGQLDFLAA